MVKYNKESSRGRYSTWHTEVGQTVLAWLAALPVDLTQLVAGTGVWIAGVDHFLCDVAQGTGGCKSYRAQSIVLE